MTIEHYTLKGLKERGWTESLVKRFLPEPDLLKTNPHYKCAAPMRLYCIDRVERIEHSTEYLGTRQLTDKRRSAAKKAVETKLDTLKRHVETIEFQVPNLDRHRLIESACRHYNTMQDGRNYASPHSSPDFLERICVNFLRHAMSEYENELSEVSGKVGIAEAYLKIKEKVLGEIGYVYPWLADECHRQWVRMHELSEAPQFS